MFFQSLPVTGVFESGTQNQVFQLANIITVNKDLSVKVMNSPIEIGAEVGDHAINELNKLTLDIILSGSESKSLYDEINDLKEEFTLLDIYTKSGIFESNIIEGISDIETTDMMDSFKITLKLREVVLAETQTTTVNKVVPSKSSQSDTKNTGQKQTTNANPSADEKKKIDDSLLYTGKKPIVDFFGSSQQNQNLLGRAIAAQFSTSQQSSPVYRQVNIQAIPNQTFSLSLDDSYFEISLKSINDNTLSYSISHNNVLLLDNIQCLPYSPFLLTNESGNFLFITNNDEYPCWTELGISQFIIYLSYSDIQAILNE